MTDADKGQVHLAIDDGVACVTFERPTARNAMTFAMYAQLLEACDAIDATPGLRAAVFRGAGGAFVAGTDITEFTAFSGGEDGVAYEARIESVISRLDTLTVPTLAAIDGPAMGGGLVIATACDLRIVTTRSRLGVPIAQTVGNCLSSANVARLIRGFGTGPAKSMLFLSAHLDGPAAHRIGFAFDCVAPEQLDVTVDAALATLRTAAPLSVAATRETFRRLARAEPADRDLIAQVYGSRDFREGVSAFLSKRKPVWRGV